MKRIALLLPAFILFACSNDLFAQNDQEAMMKAWTAYMTPSDVHKVIAKNDGLWSTSISLWMDPKAKPMTSTGTCTNKMILGGRYQESTYAGNFMGMPMEGKGTLAYDNAKKTFQSTWIDNMGTGIMILNGDWDDAAKTLNLSGTQTNPMSGKDEKVRETLKVIDDNTHLMTMYISPDGGTEFKSMEIKFTRK